MSAWAGRPESTRLCNVDLPQGRIRGCIERGAWAFRGVRYAAPPLGSLRFCSPRPLGDVGVPPQWQSSDGEPASGPAPLQPPAMIGARPVGDTAEDCLFLDVFTPEPHGSRPVMLWIHGGGFVAGSGCDPLTHGSRLAARGDVVVVTIGYRLGVFGFLAPWDDGDSVDANCGIRDQLAAIAWVRAHIAAFGGDPQRITLFGESAGAMSVFTLLTSPALPPHGLTGAIAQSGFAESVQSAAAARAVRADLAQSLGCAVSASDALRAAAIDALLTAQVRSSGLARARRAGMAFRPMIDGRLVIERPLEALRRGVSAALPLLLGSNRDEQRLYLSPRSMLSDEDLRSRVAARIADAGIPTRPAAAAADEAIRRYTAGHPGARFGRAGVWCAIDTDLGYRLPALRVADARLAHGGCSYLYLWEWESPALRGWLGACHAIDVPFVFGNLDTPGMKRFAGSGPIAEQMSDTVQVLWSNLAHGRAPSPEHLPFAAPGAPLLRIAAAPSFGPAPDAALVQFWADVGVL